MSIGRGEAQEIKREYGKRGRWNGIGGGSFQKKKRGRETRREADTLV